MVVSGSEDRTARVWSSDLSTARFTLNHPRGVNAVDVAGEVVATEAWLTQLEAKADAELEEEDKKRAKKDELEEDELETQETHPWSANEEILEEEVYVQDLGKVSDDVKVVEAEKKSWNRKPLARPIDGQTDSIRTF